MSASASPSARAASANFDFVTDEVLRTALESDERELQACLSVRAHKAALVLSGSIVEAVLVDHLESVGYKDPGGKAVTELDLGSLIAAARKEKVLSVRASELASVVKTYRNLIHPGRVARLKEVVNEDTSAVAHHLVRIVVSEVAAQKKETYGFTAQQIARKVESDSSAVAILGDLLKGARDAELERLLIDVLPSRYLSLERTEWVQDEGLLPRLELTYRAAFDAAPEAVKRRVAAEYVRVLKEDPEFEVLTFERAFFRAADLEYLAIGDADLAKRHLMARVKKDMKRELCETLRGFGRFATEDELVTVVDAGVRLGVTKHAGSRKAADDLLRGLWGETPGGTDAAIRRRMEQWEKTFADRDDEEVAAWLASLVAYMADWFGVVGEAENVVESASGEEGQHDDTYDDLPF